MPRRGKRKRLDRCIYADPAGRSIIVCGREYRELSPYGSFRDLPLTTLRLARADLERKYKGSGQSKSGKGTLAAAVDAWDPLEQHLTSYTERRSELRAWVAKIGHLRFSRVTGADVRLVIGEWKKDGVAAKTIRNRLWSLGHLYRVLNGATATSPVDGIDPPEKVRHVIMPITPAIILSVYAKLQEFERTGRLRDTKTRARFMVRASTGKRPSEIMRALPQDIDLERRVWLVRDGKGGWSEGLYLNDDMIAAWQAFAAADAWGEFNTGSMAEVLRAAGWPSERDSRGKYTSRPYHLRHSIGIDISELGIDLQDVGAWLGQTSVQTTRSHYVPVRNSRMQRISEALAGRLHGWNPVPSAAPRSDMEPRGDTRISQENHTSPHLGSEAPKQAKTR